MKIVWTFLIEKGFNILRNKIKIWAFPLRVGLLIAIFLQFRSRGRGLSCSNAPSPAKSQIPLTSQFFFFATMAFVFLTPLPMRKVFHDTIPPYVRIVW
jgi:hypothetical protein